MEETLKLKRVGRKIICWTKFEKVLLEKIKSPDLRETLRSSVQTKISEKKEEKIDFYTLSLCGYPIKPEGEFHEEIEKLKEENELADVMPAEALFYEPDFRKRAYHNKTYIALPGKELRKMTNGSLSYSFFEVIGLLKPKYKLIYKDQIFLHGFGDTVLLFKKAKKELSSEGRKRLWANVNKDSITV